MLYIRVPNHLGDACMSLPALDLLATHGVGLTLIGRPWAADLFAALPWPVIGLPDRRGERLRTLRAAYRRTRAGAPALARADALLLTNSLSTALELRLAGMHPAGYATDARACLLRPAVPVPAEWRASRMHTAEYYWQLARRLLELEAAPCPAPRLPLTDAARTRAAGALARAGARADYVVLCPVARGRHRGQVKSWSGFARLAAALAAGGTEILLCPGPGELEPARAAAPPARLIEPLELGAFGALLAGSRLVVANDSGPGHLAAAVGARLVGIFGVTDPAVTRPLGAQVRVVGGRDGWPAYGEVEAAVDAALAAP